MDWTSYVIQGIELLFFSIGTYFDIKEKTLPIPFLLFFGLLGIGLHLTGGFLSWQEMISGVVVGVLFLILGWITKEAIGYGDGITILIFGIYEGVPEMLPVVISAFFLSGIWGIFTLIRFRRQLDISMPFLPFLLLAYIGVKIL